MKRRFAALLLALLAAGCASTGSGAHNPPDPSTLTVFAAASLRKTFSSLGERFQVTHPETKVAFSFAGSSDLVSQLQNGAPADVFAAADTKTMDLVVDSQLVAGAPVPFATNTLTLAVQPGNPQQLNSLADLTRPGVQLVICAPAVPCGAATARVQQLARVRLRPVSEESSVADVLNKVATGEADAGIVYRTDVGSAGNSVSEVTIPQARRAVNTYPIATLAGGAQQALARDFVALVTGPEGQQVLRDAGFGRP
ncbi:MAG TPA: molybdate ABC transporter substrate-binding protein [Propionibacteriaceae bacterium]|nr:molybdate ABC transporter substrate-binding protein [Propionibacteriaceae bacterium]